jgi:hypothetical protein
MARRDAPRAAVDEDSSAKQAVSFRLTPLTLTWLKREGESRGWSMSGVVGRIVEDLSGWFGLPPTITDPLEADRKALGLDWRQYLMHLLARRYEDVRKNVPGFDKTK